MNRIIFIIPLFLLIFSCSTNTPSIQSSAKSVQSLDNTSNDFTPEQEYIIGRQVAANILNNYQICDDEEITEYLNLICSTIVINSPGPSIFNGYHVAIIGTGDDINLFSTPGGHIFITKGMLNHINSEDELASILAYGIATIQLWQGIDSIKYKKTNESAIFLSMTFFKVGMLALLTLSENGITAEQRDGLSEFQDDISNVFSDVLMQEYIQNQILQADSFAISLLLSAGYNPNAYLNVINNTKTSDYSSFEARLKNIENKTMGIEINDTSEYRTDRFKKIFNREESTKQENLDYPD